jgi:hypothetical protein
VESVVLGCVFRDRHDLVGAEFDYEIADFDSRGSVRQGK